MLTRLSAATMAARPRRKRTCKFRFRMRRVDFENYFASEFTRINAESVVKPFTVMYLSVHVAVVVSEETDAGHSAAGQYIPCR